MATRKQSIYPYLLVAPALLLVLCVVFFPVMKAIIMSFQTYDLRRPNSIAFCGLGNYIKAFNDALFWNSLFKTVLWVAFGVGLQFIFGFVLAVLLNQHFLGRGFVRAISLIPWFTPGVLIGLMWRWMYDGNYGVINAILTKLHIISGNIPFLAQTSTSFPSVIITIIWQGIPFFALMILAGLQGIPRELYEAAEVDGANGIQKLFKVTIPCIKNSILISLLLRIIWVANSVDVIFNMTEGGPAYSTQTLSVYVFNKAQALDLGYSSAMAILLALVLCSVAIPYLVKTFREEDQ